MPDTNATSENPEDNNPNADLLSQLEAKLSEARNKLGLSDLEQRFHALPEANQRVVALLQNLRSKGYAYGRTMQQALDETLPQRWQSEKDQVAETLREGRARLEREVRQAEWMLRDATNRSDDENALRMAEREVNDLENKLNEIVAQVQAVIDAIGAELRKHEALLRDLAWAFEQRDEASFDFETDEGLIHAVKAEWVVTGKGGKDPDGVLFLTDQRLIFEQKEKTGKMLGMFGGKQAQGLELALAVNSITETTAEDKGMMGGKDMLYLKTSDANHADITFELKGGADNDYWADLVRQVANGALASERVN